MFGYIFINEVLELFNGNFADYDNISRLTGPAVLVFITQEQRYRYDYPDNHKFDEYWYLNGVYTYASEHPFNIFRKQYGLSKDYETWPDDMKVLFKLTLD
jgi:hypothetical protein